MTGRTAYRDVHQVLEHYDISFRRGLNSGVQLELYVDADYAHEANERRSVSGEVVMCAGAGVSCRFTVAHRKASRCVPRKRSTWRRPREFARRFSCGMSGVSFFPIAMLDVPR